MNGYRKIDRDIIYFALHLGGNNDNCICTTKANVKAAGRFAGPIKYQVLTGLYRCRKRCTSQQQVTHGNFNFCLKKRQRNTFLSPLRR